MLFSGGSPPNGVRRANDWPGDQAAAKHVGLWPMGGGVRHSSDASRCRSNSTRRIVVQPSRESTSCESGADRSRRRGGACASPRSRSPAPRPSAAVRWLRGAPACGRRSRAAVASRPAGTASPPAAPCAAVTPRWPGSRPPHRFPYALRTTKTTPAGARGVRLREGRYGRGGAIMKRLALTVVFTVGVTGLCGGRLVMADMSMSSGGGGGASSGAREGPRWADSRGRRSPRRRERRAARRRGSVPPPWSARVARRRPSRAKPPGADRGEQSWRYTRADGGEQTRQEGRRERPGVECSRR